MTELSIKEFIEKLKSESPTPGGGGVASLVAAQGMALVMMAANLTLGHEEYAEWQELCEATVEEGQVLLDVLVAGIDADAEKFGNLISAYGLPRDTEEEKKYRSQAIFDASVEAAEAPLRVMESSLRGLQIGIDLLGKSNKNLESDLYIAARSLQAGMMSAKYSVFANLPVIEKHDPDLAEEFRTKTEELVVKCNEVYREFPNRK